ncbi:MAG: hypothetical protein GX558_07595, partial [Clostridiales bacterium]|nr:hypothetical protein [Clostridiales bacterium]
MVEIRIEEKRAFSAAGRKVWISGQDNGQFGRFWAESNGNGLVARLKRLADGDVMGRSVFGVSRVEADPSNRAFYFYIAAQIGAGAADDLERFAVPAAQWAIFSNRGALPYSLIEAEMHCHLDWLPRS